MTPAERAQAEQFVANYGVFFAPATREKLVEVVEALLRAVAEEAREAALHESFQHMLEAARRAEREAIKGAWDRLWEKWPTGVVFYDDRLGHWWCLGCDGEQSVVKGRLEPPAFPHEPDCRWLAMTAAIRARETA